MKKQKTSQSESATPVVRNELYQTVIDLDKSTEDATNLVDSVFELLGISYEEAGLSEDDALRPRKSATPKYQWSLRWCLKRLSWDDATAVSFRLDPRPWRLVLYLLSILPINTSVNLLVKNKFASTVKSTCSLLRNRLGTPEALEPQKDTYKSLSEFLNGCELLYLGDVSKVTRKRKRDSNPALTLRLADFIVFREIVKILRLLADAPPPDGVFSFGKPLRLQTAFLDLSIQQIAEIVGDGLSILSRIINEYLALASPSIASLDEDLIYPFVSLWEILTDGLPPQDIDNKCLPFLISCLEQSLSALAAAVKVVNGSENKNSTVEKLERLLGHSFILPFRAAKLDSKKPTGQVTAEDEHNLMRIESTLADIFSGRNGNEKATNALAPLFDLAFRWSERTTVSRKQQEDSWLERLMFTVTKLMGIHLLTINEDHVGMKASQKRALLLMLQSAQLNELKLPKLSLQNILLDISISSPSTFRVDEATCDWAIVNYCIKIDNAVILPSSDNIISLVTLNLLDKFTKLATTVWEGENAISTRSLYDEAYHKFVATLLEAYESARWLLEFLNLWKDHLKTVFTKHLELSAAPLHVFALPWADERLLVSVSLAIGRSLVPTQQVRYLQGLLQNLKSHTSNAEFLSALVVASCFVSVNNSYLSNSAVVESARALFDLAGDLLISLKDVDSFWDTHSWRIWRTISDITELTGAKLSPSRLEELAIKAQATIERRLKTKKASRESGLYTSLFALRYLQSASNCYIDAAEQIVKQLSDAIKVLLKKWRKLDLPSTTSQPKLSRSHVLVGSMQGELALMVSALSLHDTYDDCDDDKHVEQTKDLTRQACYSACREANKISVSDQEPILVYSQIWAMLINRAGLRDRKHLMEITVEILDNELRRLSSPHSSDPEAFAFLIDSLLIENLNFSAGKDHSSFRKLRQSLDQHMKQTKLTEGIQTRFMPPMLRLKDNDKYGSSYEAIISGSLTSPSSSKTFQDDELQESGSIATTLDKQALGVSLTDVTGMFLTEPPPVSLLTPKIASMLCKLKVPKRERTEDAKIQLAKTTLHLVRRLRDTSDIVDFLLLVKCVARLLRRHAWCIMQVHIDTLLSVIEFHTSGRSLLLEGVAPRAIFECLCRLFACILSSHRAKIGGRYHLVVPALKGLLRCLFQHRSNVTPVQNHLEQPSWLTAKSLAVPAECAAGFSRLLTSLCDPTVSAAKSGGKKSIYELNDPTKKARSLAGQSLQFVVLQFLSCQLQSHMEPDVRNSVMPGIYSILDSMSKAVMQNMSGAMNSEQRSVFKSLYDDWSMFGRWNRD